MKTPEPDQYKADCDLTARVQRNLAGGYGGPLRPALTRAKTDVGALLKALSRRMADNFADFMPLVEAFNAVNEKHAAELARLRSALGVAKDALEAASHSLETIKKWRPDGDISGEFFNIRGYANSRFTVAEEALAQLRPLLDGQAPDDKENSRG